MLTQYNFSSDFQDELLVCMVRYPELFIGMENVFDYGYFTGTNSQIVCKMILEFYKDHRTFPTFSQVETRVMAATRQSGNEEKALEITAYLQKLSEVNIRSKEEYRQKAVQFAQSQAIIQVSTEIVQTVATKPNYDASAFINKMREAINVGMNLEDKGVDIYQDYNELLDALNNTTYGTYTGFDIFDTKLWRRGWGPGWLIVPLAPPKRYKTAFCINLAMNMVGVKCGYDVLYYTCEINAELAALRCYQNMLGATTDEFYDDPDKFKARLCKTMPEKMRGNLIFKHYPAKTATIDDIRSHAIATIQARNLNVKAIFIDYADTVKVSESNRDETSEYRQQSSIYTEARALGCELKCCVIMPDRCNRQTVNQATPSMDSFQGAFEKAGIVDVGIGLCATDDEYERDILRYYVFLNRHGDGGTHLRGKVDPARMILTINDEMKPHETAAVEEQAQAQRDSKYGRKHPKRGSSKEEEDLRLRMDEPAPAKKPAFRLPSV